MSKIPEHILKRLQKLLSLAESASKIGSIAEAESATLKAQEIMAEYNLAISDINIGEEPTPLGDVVLNPREIDMMPKNEGTWILDLYHVIARHNYCRAINRLEALSSVYYDELQQMRKERDSYAGGSPEFQEVSYKIYKRFYNRGWSDKTMRTIRLIGEQYNIEITKFIIDQLVNKVRPMAKESWKEYNISFIGGNTDEGGEPKEKKGQYYRGFFSGFVTGVSIKLSEQKEKMETKQPQLKTMALALSNKVELYVKKNVTLKGRVRSGGTRSSDGHSDGVKAGKSTTIQKGVGTNQLNQKLLS